jgi:hypothetical protein
MRQFYKKLLHEYSFCILDHFIAMRKKCSIIKWSSLQKNCKILYKRFYMIEPRSWLLRFSRCHEMATRLSQAKKN